jgi:hypothetical protein
MHIHECTHKKVFLKKFMFSHSVHQYHSDDAMLNKHSNTQRNMEGHVLQFHNMTFASLAFSFERAAALAWILLLYGILLRRPSPLTLPSIFRQSPTIDQCLGRDKTRKTIASNPAHGPLFQRFNNRGKSSYAELRALDAE